MARPLDPQVAGEVRKITDRFVSLGEGTPVHDVKAYLGPKRHVLTQIVSQKFIREMSGAYYPRFGAQEFQEASTRKYIHTCTALVLTALKSLYRIGGARQYSDAEILSEVTQHIDPKVDADMIRTGLWFAADFREYWTGLGGTEGRPFGAITITESVLDFESLDRAWQQELKSRQEEEKPGIEPEDQPTISLYPNARKEAVMARYGKWETFGEPLGKGGQGVVYMARDTSKLDLDNAAGAIVNAIRSLAGDYASGTERNEIAADAARRILDYGKEKNPAFCGALKVLHQVDNEDDYKKQVGRMNQEVDALSKMTHPNIARMLDANLYQRWFVMEYFPERTLSDQEPRFKGDLFGALTAFRPLVEGVAEIHRKNLVHRDIKPENIFVSPSRGLVLADFGLVFFTDDDRSRVSETYENVGSRDWMPGWAFGMRVEEVRPSFDVFCLGKLLWSLVSGKRKLRLWYHHHDDFELEKMFPGDADIRWAPILLDKSIVEHEKDCLPDAGALLQEIDRVLGALRRKGQVVSDTVARICRVCGLGNYREITGQKFQGLTGAGGFRIFECPQCGHAEFFSQGHSPGPVTFRG